MIIAVLNSKGGVGKTTTAVNLAAALASPKRRVLVADLDSQASASRWLGLDRKDLRPSTASVLLEKYPILKAVRHTATLNLDLLPGSIELASADVALGGVRGRELALLRVLDKVAPHYDSVVLDGPPNLSLLTINAIVAADVVIVPLPPEPLAVDALEAQLAAIDRVAVRMAPKRRVIGILLTMVDSHRGPTREMMERLRAGHRDQLFHTEIRWTVALAEAPLTHRTILDAAPKSPSSDAFRRLAGEVLQRLGARH